MDRSFYFIALTQQVKIPSEQSVKYLGMYRNRRLTLAINIQRKSLDNRLHRLRPLLKPNVLLQ